MKKAYNVTYTSSSGKNKNIVKEQLSLIGLVKSMTDSAKQATWLVIPSDESMAAHTISAEVFKHLSPFEDEISVFRVDVLDTADTNSAKVLGFVHDCKGANEGEMRNFNRFSSRHEAFLQYQIEKPRWVHADGIGAAISVEFDEWCWLPIKKDGIYHKGKYEKYLRG